jgi:hypothetical protein
MSLKTFELMPEDISFGVSDGEIQQLDTQEIESFTIIGQERR